MVFMVVVALGAVTLIAVPAVVLVRRDRRRTRAISADGLRIEAAAADPRDARRGARLLRESFGSSSHHDLRDSGPGGGRG